MDAIISRILQLPMNLFEIPAQRIRPPNDEWVLHDGPFFLRHGGKPIPVSGRITQRWTPEPEVRFECELLGSPVSIGLADIEIHAPAVPLRADATVFNVRNDKVYSGLTQGLARTGARRVCRRVRFDLVNFLEYDGGATRFGPDHAPGMSHTRLQFRAHGWRIAVDQLPTYREARIELRESGGFLGGHRCVAFRIGERPISHAVAKDFLECAQFFFGFLNGAWCGPVQAAGLGPRKELWAEWGPWRVHHGLAPRSWFPSLTPFDTQPLFGSWRRRWRDRLWNQALRFAVHWYVHANSEARTVESGIVSAFVALELFAWLHLVEVTGRYTKQQFQGRQMHAQRKLETLLESLGIGTGFPPYLPDLARLAARRGLATGPEAIVRVRNALVHPSKGKRDWLRGVDPTELFDVKELTLEYLELTLLALLGYGGAYQKRMRGVYKAEAMASVPWA